MVHINIIIFGRGPVTLERELGPSDAAVGIHGDTAAKKHNPGWGIVDDATL